MNTLNTNGLNYSHRMRLCHKKVIKQLGNQGIRSPYILPHFNQVKNFVRY